MSALTDALNQGQQQYDSRRKLNDDINYRKASQNLSAVLEGIPYDMNPTQGDGGYANGLSINKDWYGADQKLNDRKNPGSSGLAQPSKLQQALAGTLPAAPMANPVADQSGLGLPPQVAARIQAMSGAAPAGTVPRYEDMMKATGAGVDPSYKAPPEQLPDDGGLLAQHMAEKKGPQLETIHTNLSVGHNDPGPDMPGSLAQPAGPAPLLMSEQEKQRTHEKGMAAADAGTAAAGAARADDILDARTANEAITKKEQADGPNQLVKDQGDGNITTVAPTKQTTDFQRALGIRDDMGGGAPADLPPFPDKMPGEITPPAAAPPVPPEQDINPSPYMMKRITDQNTAAAHTAADKPVPFSSLPAEWQKTLGVEGAPGGAPLSLIKEILGKKLDNEKFLAQKQFGAASQRGTELADLVRAGTISAPTALRTLMQERGGPVAPGDEALIKAMGNENAVSGRAEATLAESQKQHAIQKEEFDQRRAIDHEKRIDDQVTKYGDKLDKSGYNDAIGHLDELAAATNNYKDLSKFPGGATNLVNGIPVIGPSAANAMAGTYGGQHVLQILSDIDNVRAHGLFGARLTHVEIDRLNRASGAIAGSDPKQRRDGLLMYRQLVEEKKRTLDSSYDPEVVSKFEGRKANIPPSSAANPTSYQNKSATEPAKDDKAASGDYETELKQAQQKLSQFRESVQKAIGAGTQGAKQQAPKVREKMAQLDEYFKQKYGKGFKDAQTQ